MLVALTTAHGLLAPAAYADLVNIIDDTYNGNVTINTTYPDFTVTTEGRVQPSSGSAVKVGSEGSVDLFTNKGWIYSQNGHGIQNEGHIGTLENTNFINSQNNANLSAYNGLYLGTESQTDHIINKGSINASVSYDMNNPVVVNNAAIYNRGHVGSLTNEQNGRISGNTALQNSGVIDLLQNDGNMESYSIGIISSDINATLINNSTIINKGTIATLNNTGSITSYNYYDSSDSTAIRNSGTITALNNYGTISGSTTAIDSIGTITDLHNEGVIKGDIYVAGNAPLNITGGSSTQGKLTGSAPTPIFGIFAMGPVPVIEDTIGTLSAGGDINFNVGSILLNDNIFTGGTVYNNASKIQVNAPIAINGNYHQKSDATLIIGVADNAVANGDAQDSGYGRLNVTGSAIVDAGSRVNLVQKPAAMPLRTASVTW